MTRVQARLTSTVRKTGRLAVAAGSMDHPVTGETSTVLDVDVPIEDRPWTVGLVVGPSGAGKSTVAAQLWPGLLTPPPPWPTDRAVVDAFPEAMTASQVTDVLSRVGLGSVPAWIRPFHCLSNGEQFRAELARSLATAAPDTPVVVDEFTSVVDRQVAQVASHTVAKWCRAQNRRFVGVACHYDIVDWLQPDWLLDMATQAFTWRSVQPRPRIELAVYKVPVAAWRLFRAHHYLSADISNAAQCYAAFVGDTPVAFTSYLHFPHPRTKTIKMGHRLVVLPDWQGLGVARVLEEWLGELLAARGLRYRNAVAHPAMKHLYGSSPRWQLVTSGMRATGTTRENAKSRALVARHRTVRMAGLVSFEYRPRRREGS